MTDPEHPELLRFLDGPPNTMTIQAQVADGTMITALEHPRLPCARMLDWLDVTLGTPRLASRRQC